MSDQAYAGDISVVEIWERLQAPAQRLGRSVLVDVRTRAEWAFVGIPDLSPIGGEPVLIEWQTFPTGQPNLDFVSMLEQNLADRNVDKATPIYFLCRSGTRSAAAATAMTTAGYGACYNITEGFEGPIDENGHRGTVSGWKQCGLPWRQS